MAGVPGGILSFLYNVTYDSEFNKRFDDNEEEVMEFFQLPLNVREAVRRVSVIERGKSDEIKKLRAEIKRLNKRSAKAISKEKQLKVKEEEYIQRDVVPPDEMDIVIRAITEELNGGVYRRFW